MTDDPTNPDFRALFERRLARAIEEFMPRAHEIFEGHMSKPSGPPCKDGLQSLLDEDAPE